MLGKMVEHAGKVGEKQEDPEDLGENMGKLGGKQGCFQMENGNLETWSGCTVGRMRRGWDKCEEIHVGH